VNCPASHPPSAGRSFFPEKNIVIRPTVPDDTPILVKLAQETDVFKPHEIQALQEVLDDYHATYQAHGHKSITHETKGHITGFAYYAPAAMTERTWYLYWIAVTRHTQARGIGSALLKHVEEDIRALTGRLLLIETSSLPSYDLTRKFYVKHKYDQAAQIADYYADGDDLVVFRKRMNA
jgi:ribosomal protein S18 acetylase RimI-like enzyme